MLLFECRLLIRSCLSLISKGLYDRQPFSFSIRKILTEDIEFCMIIGIGCDEEKRNENRAKESLRTVKASARGSSKMGSEHGNT